MVWADGAMKQNITLHYVLNTVSDAIVVFRSERVSQNLCIVHMNDINGKWVILLKFILH